MAALNFPPSPSTNQIYSANGKSWRFDGTSWKTFYILNVQGGGTGNTSYNLGDILVGAGTSLYPLPVGSNSFVLTADSTAAFGITWRSTAATGITTLNSLTATNQYFSFGYSGDFPNISSFGETHTFNIPIAGAGATGLVSTSNQTFAGQKTFTSAIIGDLTGTATTAGFALTASYAHQSGYAITSGFATTASYSYQSGYGITAGFASTAAYSHQAGYATTSGFATTANYAYQSGYGITSGFATTASYSYESGYGITAGFATTASYAYQSGYGITSGFATTASYAYQSGYGITSGFATTASYSYESGYGITSGFATTASYAHQSGYGITAGFASTASYSHQSGYGITAGFATTSANINVVNATSNLAHPLIFGSTASGSGVAVSSNTTISFNPSTFILSTSGLAITAPTVSTSSSTGALTVSGGVGIGGSLFLSSSLPSSLSGVVVNNGVITSGSWSGSTITAFYGGTGYNSYTKGDILVGAGNTFIKLNVGTDDYVLTASSVSSTGLTWSPTAATGLTTLNGLSTGIQYLAFGYTGTVPAFSSSGSTHTLNIPIAGTGSTGLVSTQAQSFAGIKTFTNAVSITDSTGSGSYTSGALTVTGGVGIGGTLNVQGDFNVQGTFTTINSTTITVADKNIELGVVATPTDLTAEGGGITLRGATNKSINWYSGVGWSSSESLNLASGNTFKINGTNVLSSNTLGTGVIFSSIQTAGIITSGTWSATAITALYGGTGLVPTFTVGDILYANTSTTWGRLTANSNSGFVLVSAGSGATPTYVNPNTLSVGFASTATYSYQSGYAITSGLATTASYSHQSGYAITSGSAALATTATYAHQSGYAITSGFATTASYSYQSGYGLTSGLATTANYSHQSGYAITSGSSITSAFATTAANLNVSSAVSGLFYPVLSNTASSASGIGASVNSFFSFNAATGAFGATSVNILSGQSYSVGGNNVLSATSLGTGVTNSSLTALGTITTGVWAGSLITGFYGGTGYNSYTKGDILVGAGSTFIKLNVGADNFVLTANSSSATGVTWSPTAATGITTLNSLNATQQFFSTGTSGTGFNIASSGSTHTFNIPIAGTGATGLVSTLAQSFAGVKTFTNDVIISSTTGSTAFNTGALTVYGGLGVSGQLSFNQAALGYTGATNPSMAFIGSTTAAPITLTVLSDNSLLWEGTSGKLFGINNNLSSGWIFNVGDISGLPIIRANADGTIAMAEFTANVGIGLSNPSYKLHVVGDTNLSSSYVYRINGTSVLSATSLGTGVTNSSLTAVGTISTGVWAATAITSFYGGTGYQTYSTGDLLVGTGATLTKLAVGTNNFVLTADNTVVGGLKWTNVSGLAITNINGLTASKQDLAFGYSGTVPSFSSSGSTHTLNIPIAGSGATGLISTLAQTIAGQKTFTSAIIGDLTGTATTASFASTANYAHQAGYAITSGFATTASYSYQSGYGITSGFATTANYAYQSGYGITSGFATTANYAHQSGYAITSGFASTSSYSYQSGYAITSGLASTSTLALTVSSNSTSVNADYNIPFFSGTALSTNNSLYYNPSTGRFNAPIHTGTWAGNTITSFYGGTGFSTYSTGDLLVGAGATLSKLSVGTNNFILVADSAVPGGIKWANVSGFAITNINGLTASRQDLAFGYSGTVPAFSSSGSTHTLNIPLAGTGSTGLVSTQAQSFAGIKTFTNAVSITDSTGSGSYTTGALVVAGGVGVGGTLNVQGDLNVQGTFTTINSTTITVADKNIELGVVATPTDLTAQGGGITLRGATDKSINWYSGVGWSSSESWNLASGNTFKINGTNVLSSSSLGTGVTNSSLTAVGTVTTGVWSATAVTALYGGTGLVPSFTVGDILYANTTSTWGRLTANSNSGYVLVSAGSGATPTYVAPSTLSVGFASTSSYSYQSGYAITSGLATTASYSYQAGYAITSGLATTATYAHQSGYGLTAGLATTATYAHQSGYGLTAGLATTATYAHQSGYAITSGFATTAANINIVSAATNTNHRVLFTPASGTASGAAVSIENTFVYNPSTDILSVSGLAVTASTSSTNSSTGALIVAGGVGIGGTVYTATDLNVGNSTTGRLYFSQATLGSAGTTVIPSMAFIGTTNSPITLSVLADNSLSFDGSSGQLFSINNNLSSGWIFAVNDISGLPLLRANADGTVAMGEFAGNVGIGLSNPSYKLQVAGDTNLSSGYVYRINGTQVLSSTSLGTGVTNSSLTAVGTITTGTWSATAITAFYGGTGYNSYTVGDLLVGAGSTLYKLPIGTNNFVLTADNTAPGGVKWSVAASTGVTTINALTSSIQYFATGTSGSGFNISSSGSTHTFNVPIAGTGATGLVSTLAQSFAGVKTFTNDTVISSNTVSTSISTGAFTVTGGVGIGGSLYTGTSSADSISGVVLNNGVITSGSWAGSTITALYGGTGYNSYTKGDVLVGAGNTFIKFAVGANNYVLGANSASGSGLTWRTASSATAITSIAPSNPLYGDFWYDSTDGSLSVYYNDVDTSQWVEVIGAFTGNVYFGTANSIPYYESSGIGITGSANFTNVGTGISILYTTPSTSTTTGALVVSGGVGIGGSLYTATTSADSISGVVLNNGVITSGNWSATAVTARYGGTGNTSYTLGDLLVGAGSTFIKLPVGINSYVLGADSSKPSGVGWTSVTPLTVSDTAPTSPKNADLWFNSADGGLLVYYQDINTSQWVEIALGSGIDLTQQVHITNTTPSTSTSSGALIVDGGVGIQGALHTSSLVVNGTYDVVGTSVTLSTTTADQVIYTLDASIYRSVKFMVQISCGSDFQVQEILLLHDTLDTYLTQYAQLLSGNNLVLATYDADLNSGNIRLLVTPTYTNTTFKIYGTAVRD
jgi:hypothetical protein